MTTLNPGAAPMANQQDMDLGAALASLADAPGEGRVEPGTAPAAPADLGIYTEAPVYTPATPAAPVAAAPVVAAPAPVVDAPVSPAAPTGVDVNALMQSLAATQASQAAQAAATNALLERIANPPQPAAPPPAPFSVESVLDATEKAAYADLTPMLQRILSAQQNHTMNTYVAPLQAQLAQATAQLEETRASTTNAHTAALYAAVPELPTLINTPGWQAHLRSTVPLTTSNVGSVLSQALNQGNHQLISQHVKAYMASQGTTPAPKTLAAPAGSSVAAAPAPVSGSAGVPTHPGAVGSAGVVSLARLDQGIELYRNGKMTPDAYQSMQDQAMNALIEGASFQ